MPKVKVETKKRPGYGAVAVGIVTLILGNVPKAPSEIIISVGFTTSVILMIAEMWRWGWVASAPKGERGARRFLLSLAICTCAIGCGYWSWPSVSVTDHLFFKGSPSGGPGETLPITVTNHKAGDVYHVAIGLDFGDSFSTDFKIFIPKESLRTLRNGRPGPKAINASDISAIACKGNHYVVLFVDEIRSGERRDLEITKKSNGTANLQLDVENFSKDGARIISDTETGSRITVPDRPECNGNLPFTWITIDPTKE